MVSHENSKITERMHEDTFISPVSALPKELAPVLVCNPRRFVNVVVEGNSGATQTAKTIYTTPSTKDFYLTSLTLSHQSNVTADNVEIVVKGYVNGEQVNLILFRKLTTTVTEGTTSLSLPIPLKLDRGSIISYRNVFTVGASAGSVVVMGYVVDTPNKKL